MKLLLLVLFVVIILAGPAFASSNKVVSHYPQVVTAFDPNDYYSQQNVVYHADVAVNVHAGNDKSVVFAVSEPQYTTHAALVAFVGADHVATKVINVVVQNGILAKLAMYVNQTVVSCVKKVVVNGYVVKKTVVKQKKVSGFLTGTNAYNVKVAVDNCY